MPRRRPQQLEPVLATIGGSPPLVERHRLAPLFEGLDGVRLVLVRAPAGYGKTILLRCAWRRFALGEARASWTTLSAEDDDPPRIRRRIDDALERALAAGSGGRVIALVDGIEEIHGEAEAALGAAIAALDDEATIVLASRRLPEIGVGELRLRGELREITSDDLRFDLDETRALFRSAGRPSPDVVLERFLRLTEGWPAALRLAATGAGSGEDPDPASCCPEVAEYLAESVLARQPADVRRFLLRTCVPSRLTPELCDALTDGDDGMRMLGRLERAGSFLVRIDGRPRWFRYHRLFRAFLRDELARDAEERPAELHRRAASWLAARGHFLEAAEQAFDGGDAELAARLLDDGALDSIRRGESAAVLRWTRRLSPESLRAHPRFAIAAAWARLLRRDADGARSALAAVDRGRARRAGGSPALEDEVLCLEAFVALAEDRLDELAAIALDRRSRLSAEGTFEHGATCNLAALGLAALGRFDEARRLALEAKASHRRTGSAFGEAFSLAIHGAVAYAQGAPAEALATYRRVDEIPRDAAGRTHARAVVATPIAEALYELDRLDEAETVLLGARDLPADFAWVDASGNPHLVRARILAARGELDRALRVLEDGEFEAMLRSFPRMAVTMRWEEVRFLTRAGRIVEAAAKANGIGADGFRERVDVHHAASEDEARDLTALRLAIRTGQARVTAAILATEAAEAKRRGRLRRWLKAQTLHAEALDALGERRPALRALREAVLFGASRGFVRSFADEGAALVPLLEELREVRGVGEAEGTELSAEDLDRILAAARGVRAERPCASAALATEPLSPRERELLALVDAGLSNRSIARRLCVSENTVKTHVRHIYGKLHVTSRTAALAHARRQGLLS